MAATRYIVQIHNPGTGQSRRRAVVCLERSDISRRIILAPGEIISQVREGGLLDKLYAGWVIQRSASPEAAAEFYNLVQTYLGVTNDAAKAFERAVRQVSHPALANAILRVLDQLKDAVDADTAFCRFKGVLPEPDVEALIAGRSAGNLGKVIERLRKRSDSKAGATRKIRRAMLYPMIVIFIASALVALLVSKQLPAMVQNYRAFGVTPKGAVATIFRIGEILSNAPWVTSVLPLSILLIYLNLGAIGANPTMQRILFKYPAVRRLMFKRAMSDCLSTYALLRFTNVEMKSALEITSRQTVVRLIRAFFLDCRDELGRGAPSFFASAIKHAHLLGEQSYELISMMQAGEETGTQAEIAERIAQQYERDSDDALDNLGTIIGPVFLILTAVVVVGVMLLTIVPTMQLNMSLVPTFPH